MIVRLIYAYPTMAPIRHDLLLFLGPWHNYHYGVISLWMEFRSTFLGPAFFSLFPKELLKYRMPLSKSVVFLQWLRRAYPKFKDILREAISTCKAEIRDFEVRLPLLCRSSQFNLKDSKCPSKAKYIHLLNLLYLFEYAIPTILDYGTLLKSDNYPAFRESLLRLMLFYFSCEQKGHYGFSDSNLFCRCSSISEITICLLFLLISLGKE